MNVFLAYLYGHQSEAGKDLLTGVISSAAAGGHVFTHNNIQSQGVSIVAPSSSGELDRPGQSSGIRSGATEADDREGRRWFSTAPFFVGALRTPLFCARRA